PGAKKAAPAAAAPADPAAEAPPKPAAAAPVTGLGMAAGAKRPGAKKSTPPAQPTPAEPTPAAAQPESTAETPASDGDRDGGAPTPPVKGLGIARGARPPGKR
ncbi:MAG TPA: FeS-binding protein, partial [Mycobacterium sp.]|nr:FeS-binding protein [Mycobacterium sp.]